jgi:hypothetical protein
MKVSGKTTKRVTVAGFAALLVTFLASEAEARNERASLSGSWRGGGSVSFSGGQRENARCQAHFSQSGAYVTLNAHCATPSGSVQQSARLRQTGPNSFSGSFHNSQYNVSGSIHITVHGNRQSVSLRSGSGSASLTLHR